LLSRRADKDESNALFMPIIRTRRIVERIFAEASLDGLRRWPRQGRDTCDPKVGSQMAFLDTKGRNFVQRE